MRLNRRQLVRTGSRTSVLVAITLLMMLGAVALTIDSGGARFAVAGPTNPSRLFASKSTPPAKAPQQVLATYSRLPLTFEPNQGQTDRRVRFLARGSGYGLYLTAHEAVLALQQSAANPQHPAIGTSVVSMKLVGASFAAAPVGDVQLSGKSNYFIGNDPAKWHRDIPQFARVRYRNVYPGIDLVYYGNQGRLEYDFEIAPGVDPKQVALKFQGPHNLKIDAGGDLVLGVGGSDVRLEAPRVYQKFGAEQRSVAGRFELRGKENDEVGFEVGAYDRRRALIIDPVLIYASYLGGSGDEACSVIAPITVDGIAAAPPGCPAIAVDAVSNVYVAGSTTSATDFPGTTGEYQTALAPGATANAFIAKFSATGLLKFATYLGGDRVDYPAGIGVDAGFDLIVAGTTSSSNFPTGGTNAAFQANRASAGNHVFVSKLDPTGKTLLYSTYLSGDGADMASGLAVDSGGTAFVTGTTASSNFPTTFGALQTTRKADHQSFFSRVDPNSSGTQSLMYSTYIGGGNPSTGATVGGGIAVDINSNAYITGGTNFTDFPVLNAYQGKLNVVVPGTTDAFVMKINPAGLTGTQLLYSTYFGGSGDDVGYGIAVDSTTNAYITGSTTSTDIVAPTGTTPFQAVPLGGGDAFLAKFGTLCTGTSCTTTDVPFTYFTYLGGSRADVATAVAVDGNQGAHLTGWTTSATDFPVAGTPLQSTFAGMSDAFVARIDTVSTANESSYFGGINSDMGTGIALDQQGATYLSGETFSPNGFLGHAFQGALNGQSDAFVSKLGPVLNLTLSPAPSATPSPVGVGGQVSFKYTIMNGGEFTNGVTFTDHLQASGETFVSATPSQGTCGGAANQTVLCNVGALNGTATATVTVIVTPVAPTTPGNSVILGNSGSVGVGGSTLDTAVASVKVNDFTLGVAPASATVPAGVPATLTATVTPSANDGFPGSVSLACGSGLPTGASCLPGNNNPIQNLNTGAQSAQLIINTTARVTTTTDLRHGGMSVPLYAWLPVSGLALFGVGLGGKRSRRGRALMGFVLACFFALIVFQAGCGSTKHTTTTIGTPAGTYPVTINATTGTNATRTTVITLVVE